MKNDNLLLMIAVVAVVVSIAAAGVTYFSVANLVTKISGFATSTGVANLTVESVAIINFSTSYITWGSGKVNTGVTTAGLNTLGTTNVTNGNWTLQQAGGFRIENIGNTNVSLMIATGKTAATFLGGTNPSYHLNYTAVESQACLNSSGTGTAGLALTTWVAVNTTAPGNLVCSIFPFLDAYDLVRIDVNLSVPYDSGTGERSDTLTATATAI